MPIQKVVKGSTPTLLDTDKANELIDAINKMVSSKGEGYIYVHNDNGKLVIGTQGIRSVNGGSFFESEEIDTSTESNTIDLTICQNGSAVTKTFLLASAGDSGNTFQNMKTNVDFSSMNFLITDRSVGEGLNNN